VLSEIRGHEGKMYCENERALEANRLFLPDIKKKKNFMFHILALRNIRTCVVTRQTSADKICFIIYQNSPTCFGRKI